MRYEFKLPDIGEGMVEGEIVKWYVKVGDELQEDEPMLDVMTDKATVTISAPKSGRVLELNAKEGEIKKVGAVLIALETKEAVSQSKPAHEGPASLPRTSGNGETEQEQETKPERGGVTRTAERVLATPTTRRLAHELGIDLARVSGTGAGGRITPEDVRASLDQTGIKPEKKGASFAPTQSSQLKEQRIPFKGLRRKIAEKMVASKTKIPHFTYVDEADVSELVVLREKAENQASSQVKLSYLPFIVKAVAAALKKHPVLNSVLDEEHEEILLKGEVNIGIGAATPEGLTVFVVRNADQKKLFDLAKEIQELAEKARLGKLSIHELGGSTFTITSLGPLGGMFATPIINYPEVAILGIHRIQKRPVVRENQIVVREMMYVSLSFDHRVIDGDVGARFAHEVIEQLEHPALLL